MARNESIKQQCLLFGLSITCIEKARHQIINAINQLFANQFNLHSAYWTQNLKFVDRCSAFESVFGAIDGAHCKIRVKMSEHEIYRNRNKVISSNVLILCNFRQRILFIWPGCGSSHDSSVYKNSILPNMFNALPPGKFVLGDAGYGLSKRILTPYRGVR